MDTPKKDNIPGNNSDANGEQTTCVSLRKIWEIKFNFGSLKALLNETKLSEVKSNIPNRRHSSFFNIESLHAHDDDSFRGKCYRLINSVNFQVSVVKVDNIEKWVLL